MSDKVEESLRGLVTLSPLYCRVCGRRELVTLRQVRAGCCEYCAVAGVTPRTPEEIAWEWRRG
jgi:hypothetical protein